MNEKEQFFTDFNNQLHRIGRITMLLMITMLLGVPFLFAAVNGVGINWGAFAEGILKVGIIYFPSSIVEFLIYTPMLGVGGSYLSFITGNVTNMRIPCAMNAAQIAGTEAGTAEHEIVTTLAVATSAITTTAVIVLGVIALVPLQPVLNNPVLAPAFDYVVPSLFGALGLKYFSKSLKLSIPPLALMSVACIAVPSLIAETSMMMIPIGAAAIALAFLLWKKDQL